MAEKILKNDYIKVWKEEGIVFGEYLPGTKIDMEAAEKVVEIRLKICEGKNHPHIVHINGLDSVTKGAREYLFNKVHNIRFYKLKIIELISFLKLITLPYLPVFLIPWKRLKSGL